MTDQKKPSQTGATGIGAGLHCANHPDTEAYGMCMHCGRFFCQACLVKIHDGKQYCKEHVEIALVGERTTPSSNASNTNSHNTYNNDHSSNNSHNTYNNNNSTNNSHNTYNNDHSTNNSGNTYNYYYGDPTSSGATSNHYSGSSNSSGRSTNKSDENGSSSDATNTQDLPWYKKAALWVTNTFNGTTTTPTAPSHKPTKKGKSRLIALVLCILGFFGFAGLHRMYVGKIGSGILYLFTYGGFFIGTIIDTLSILGGKFKDKNGRRL